MRALSIIVGADNFNKGMPAFRVRGMLQAPPGIALQQTSLLGSGARFHARSRPRQGLQHPARRVRCESNEKQKMFVLISS